MHDEKHRYTYDIQAELATVREEAHRYKAALHRRLHDDLDDLDDLDPLAGLEQAAWLMRQVSDSDTLVGTLPPSPLDVAKKQQAALDYILASMFGHDDLLAQISYTRGVLLELDLMHDYDGIIRVVRKKVARIIEHLREEQAASVVSLEEALQATRAELDEAKEALRASIQAGAVGTTTTWQHLARAAILLNRYSDLKNKADFVEQALRMHIELGLEGEDPGGAIWRGVQRLGIMMLQTKHLPEHYCQFEGFRRLIVDLIRGSLS